MAAKDGRWQCTCLRLNGPTAEYCGQCGSHWQSGWSSYGQRQRPKSRAPSQRSRKGRGKGKNKSGKEENTHQEEGKPTTPRSVRTSELKSPDFRKPNTVDGKEGQDEKTPYTPEKAGSDPPPIPPQQEVPAQLLLALLKDVAEGKASASDALQQATKAASSTAAAPTHTESKDVHKVGRQLAKAQAKTKKAYEILKKMKEDWSTWTKQVQDLYNRKIKQYEEAHRAWTLILQDALTAEKAAKAELQALGQTGQNVDWEEIELDDKDFPEVFDVTSHQETESTELLKVSPRKEEPPDGKGTAPPKKEDPADGKGLALRLEAAALAALGKDSKAAQEKKRQREKNTPSEGGQLPKNKEKKGQDKDKLKQGRLDFPPRENRFAPLGGDEMDGIEPTS